MPMTGRESMSRTLAALLLAAALGSASTGAPLARDQWVRGQSNLYEIQATGFRWQRMAPGSSDWKNADLALRESADSALLVYVYERSKHSLDELVETRRR